MRCVFAHLKSGWQTTPFIHGRKPFFLEDPDCPTLVVKQVEEEEQQKVSGPGTPQETSSDFSFYIFIYIIYITFRILLFVNFR